MTLVSAAAFFLVWSVIIGAPVAAMAAFILIRGIWPRRQPSIITGCVVALFSISAFPLFGFSFTATLANFAGFVIAYSIYCFLGISCWRIRLLAVRIPVIVIAVLPLVAGYALGTVGVLGLGWIVADYSEPAKHTESIRNGLTCRITHWGAAVGDSGYTVHLYWTWSAVPFLEREVGRITVDETNPKAGAEDASCSDVVAMYAR
jgi:hypothetical protein